MSRILITDSSTLIALERVKLLEFLGELHYSIKIPRSVNIEIGNICKEIKNVEIEELRGKTLKISRSLQRLGIGEGEADCVALAGKFKLYFIVCDDRKLMRQIIFSNNKEIRNIKLLGFSFFLHEFFKKNLLNDVWKYFNLIVEKSNLERSEVQVANYTFLKEIRY